MAIPVDLAQRSVRVPSVRSSTLVLLGAFFCLFAVLMAVADALPAAHADLTIQYFASDAAVYYEQYHRVWSKTTITESPVILLTGTPIVLMQLTGGNLTAILVGNLIVMLLSLKAAMSCFEGFAERLAVLAGTLAFPYFLFGFVSLNKEIYAMCSAIFFASYWLQGKRRYLAAALLLGFAARYYMLFGMLFLYFVFPRERAPRYWLAGAALLLITVAAPFVKSWIPSYSSSGILEGAGATALLFSRAVDSFGYALVYPLKYAVLLPSRIYSVMIGLGRPIDPLEALVALLTVALLVPALYILVFKRTSLEPKGFALMALLGPIPLMWTEIAHWRYFSYVYFFLLFCVVTFLAERLRNAREAADESECARIS